MSFEIQQPPFSVRHEQTIWLVTDDQDVVVTDRSRRRRLAGLPGSLHLRTRSPDDREESGLGHLIYNTAYSDGDYSHEEGYGITLRLTDEEFSDIRSLLVAGREPLRVHVYTPDLDFGIDPDGRSKDWRIDQTPIAKITGFAVDIFVEQPLTGAQQWADRVNKEEEARRQQAASTAVINACESVQLVGQTLAQLAVPIDKVMGQLRILLLFSAGSLVFLALLYFRR